MLATFANKLQEKKVPTSNVPLVYYTHNFRCPVDVWFERSYKNKFGWVVQFKAKSNRVLEEFRGDIFKQAIHYIERRTKRPVTEVSFDEILELAEALEIKKVTLH
tara:strand:- start:159983 stop:160297 length:315 start_codon:yes stop_codon:yes gene_type:complete